MPKTRRRIGRRLEEIGEQRNIVVPRAPAIALTAPADAYSLGASTLGPGALGGPPGRRKGKGMGRGRGGGKGKGTATAYVGGQGKGKGNAPAVPPGQIRTHAYGGVGAPSGGKGKRGKMGGLGRRGR